jgi:hypothetical protein
VVESCVARLYESWPELETRFGDHGRALTAEDCHWHLNYLDVALSLGDLASFHRYVEWLVRFLTPRGVEPSMIAGALVGLADALDEVGITSDLEGHRRMLVEVLRREAGQLHTATGG